MSDIKIHPVANLFPMLSRQELEEMANSIKKDGLLNPCMMHGDILLDGRNRIEACKIAGVSPRFSEYSGDSPVSFIISANMARRHLSKEQKYALFIEVEPMYAEEAEKRLHLAKGRGVKPVENVPQVNDPTNQTSDDPKPNKRNPPSRDQAAKAVGVSGKTGDRLKKLKKQAPDLFQSVIDKKTTLARAVKDLNAREDKRDLANAQSKINEEKRKSIESVCDLRVCSCAELFKSGITPDAVITDPPYPAEFLHVFTELADGCADAKVKVVAVMSGQSYLPEVYRRLSERLKYRWTLAYMTPGGQAVQQWQAKVNTSWKPVLLFGDSLDWFGDVAISKPNDNDKRFHGWGQSESGMADLIDRLTKPGDLVCDPFVGGGTTAVACIAMGRRFVGCDIDAKHVEQSKQRVASCL